MTSEEAKKIIFNQWQLFLEDNIDYGGISEAYKMAMKALEQQPSEDCRNCKKWNKCPCGKEGHENGTSIGYSIGECKDYEPSEDCISREQAKQFLYERIDRLNDDELYDIFSRIIDDMVNHNLSPVIPKYTDEEIDRAQAVEQAYVDKMVELAVEETKRPKGKWTRDLRMWFTRFSCSNCGKFCDFDYLYCPNCGAKMSGGEEDEVGHD